MDKLAVPHINQLQSYVPGKPIESLAREKNLSKIIKLASNENPYGPSPLVIEAIIKNISAINQYPDPDQHDLKNSLSNFYNITSNMLAIGNGSDELLQVIMRAFVNPHNNVISPNYSFISYKIGTQSVGAEFISTEINSNWQNNLDNILNSINKNTKLICLANPNNPLGTYLDIPHISNFLKSVPSNVLVLLDEAYFEYVKYNNQSNNNIDPSIELIKQFPNLIITRTFSKAYGLAGLRIGYSIAHPNVTAIINKVKQPFNSNRLVQFVGPVAIADQEYIKKIVAINSAERDLLYQEFERLNINYIKSCTNFVMIETHYSQELYNYLLNQGIIVRPVNNYGLTDYLRISIGLPEENKTLVNSLNGYNNTI